VVIKFLFLLHIHTHFSNANAIEAYQNTHRPKLRMKQVLAKRQTVMIFKESNWRGYSFMAISLLA
jgi:hypothetical protein